jgi:hypothetical protein
MLEMEDGRRLECFLDAMGAVKCQDLLQSEKLKANGYMTPQG